MTVTQEFITAEINYRLERAQAAALVNEAREAARAKRSSRVRRWFTRSQPVRRHVTPALP
jgi:hypothetical protein